MLVRTSSIIKTVLMAAAINMVFRKSLKSCKVHFLIPLHGKSGEMTRKWRIEKEGEKREFLEKFKSSFPNIIKHVHCVSWQYSQISGKRAALKLGEVMLGMDFAEKWRTSWQWEVSSAHYGYKLTSVFPIVAHYKCPHDDCSKIVKEAIACGFR